MHPSPEQITKARKTASDLHRRGNARFEADYHDDFGMALMHLGETLSAYCDFLDVQKDAKPEVSASGVRALVWESLTFLANRAVGADDDDRTVKVVPVPVPDALETPALIHDALDRFSGKPHA